MEDSAIIDLYWAREERALSETDTKYGGYCRSIAHNILKNREDSEECVSDTWLHAWNAMPPQRPSILSSFLGRITRNLSFDRCRRQNAEKRGGGSLPLALENMARRSGTVSFFFSSPETSTTTRPASMLQAGSSRRSKRGSWPRPSTAFSGRFRSASAAFSCGGTGTSIPCRISPRGTRSGRTPQNPSCSGRGKSCAGISPERGSSYERTK